HAKPDHFERHVAADRLPLLSEINGPHSAFAKHSDWHVRPERIFFFWCENGAQPRGSLKKGVAHLIANQEGLYFSKKFFVITTPVPKELGTLGRIVFYSLVENRFCLLPTLRRHTDLAVILRLSQALADLHSRLIVAVDTPITSAASSTLSPAKKRSSM